jgi:hypothetical protein
MKEELLKELLEKYYNGETSLEEEQSLRDFFSNANVPGGYEAEKEIFSYYPELALNTEPDDDLEGRIRVAIDRAGEPVKTRTRFLRPYTLTGIAAGLLILIASYFILADRKSMKDTYSDPQLAYVETIKILREVSFKFNKGTAALKPLAQAGRVAEAGIGTVSRSAARVTDKLKPLAKISDLNKRNNYN